MIGLRYWFLVEIASWKYAEDILLEDKIGI